MMVYRRPRRVKARRRGYAPPRRQNLWVRTAATPVTPAQPGLYYPELLPATLLDPGARLGSTVVRVLAELTIIGAVTDFASTAGGIHYGVAVMPGTDPDAGQPVRDANAYDWMSWGWIALAKSGVGLFQPTSGLQWNFTIDVKASRRFNAPDENLYIAVQTQNILATATVNFSSSVLLKLA